MSLKVDPNAKDREAENLAICRFTTRRIVTVTNPITFATDQKAMIAMLISRLNGQELKAPDNSEEVTRNLLHAEIILAVLDEKQAGSQSQNTRRAVEKTTTRCTTTGIGVKMKTTTVAAAKTGTERSHDQRALENQGWDQSSGNIITTKNP